MRRTFIIHSITTVNYFLKDIILLLVIVNNIFSCLLLVKVSFNDIVFQGLLLTKKFKTPFALVRIVFIMVRLYLYFPSIINSRVIAYYLLEDIL